MKNWSIFIFTLALSCNNTKVEEVLIQNESTGFATIGTRDFSIFNGVWHNKKLSKDYIDYYISNYGYLEFGWGKGIGVMDIATQYPLWYDGLKIDLVNNEIEFALPDQGFLKYEIISISKSEDSVSIKTNTEVDFVFLIIDQNTVDLAVFWNSQQLVPYTGQGFSRFFRVSGPNDPAIFWQEGNTNYHLLGLERQKEMQN